MNIGNNGVLEVGGEDRHDSGKTRESYQEKLYSEAQLVMYLT